MYIYSSLTYLTMTCENYMCVDNQHNMNESVLGMMIDSYYALIKLMCRAWPCFYKLSDLCL